MKEVLNKIKPVAEKIKTVVVAFAIEVKDRFKADDGTTGSPAWKSRFVNSWRSGKEGKIAIAGVSAIVLLVSAVMLPSSKEDVKSTASVTRESAKVESGEKINEEFFKEAEVEEHHGSGLIEQARKKTGKAVAAYAAVRNSFYGVGRYKKMMKTSVCVDPNGTPVIDFNENWGEVEVKIRLSVNEPYYNAWKKAAYKYLEKMGMNDRIRELKTRDDSSDMIVGGRRYVLDTAESNAVKKAKKLDMGDGTTVCVQLIDKDGQAARTVLVSLYDFGRVVPSEDFGLPYHELSRLMDLPGDVFRWYADEKPANEDTFAIAKFHKMTKDQFAEMKDVRCTILDDGDLQQMREQASAKAIASLISGMVKVPGQDFLIGSKEVSRIQWDAVMGDSDEGRCSSGVFSLTDLFSRADNAATEISWNNCQTFVKKLNDLPAVKAAKLRFRLPKESEWLLAWKADGTEGKRRLPGFEKADGMRQIDYLGPMEWQKSDSGETKRGQFALYHLHDNALDGCEWCEDVEGDGHVVRYGDGDSRSEGETDFRGRMYCLRLVASPE